MPIQPLHRPHLKPLEEQWEAILLSDDPDLQHWLVMRANVAAATSGLPDWAVLAYVLHFRVNTGVYNQSNMFHIHRVQCPKILKEVLPISLGDCTARTNLRSR